MIRWPVFEEEEKQVRDFVFACGARHGENNTPTDDVEGGSEGW